MFVVFVLLFILAFPPPSNSTTPEEEYRKIQEKMVEQKKKLNEAQERESSVLSEIDAVNMKLGGIEAELRRYRQNLRRTEEAIAGINTDIEKTRNSLEKQKDWIKRKLRLMQRFGYSEEDSFVLLLNSNDVSQMMRMWKYLERITLHEHKILEDYRENLRELDEKYKKLQSLKIALSENTEKVKSKEGELSEKKKAKEIILSSVKTEKAARQKMLAELKDASRKLQEIIKESSKTDHYAATGFQQLKGRLPWPVPGRIAVRYGSQKDPQFYTPVFRNGIHIQTNADTDAKAVHAGKVIFAEWFKGFGQLIIINHGGGYHTLYGNLSEIFSHVGDIIKENEVIGKVGTSGVLNAPGLYFEIRYKGKPLDPAQWLRNKRG